MRRLENGFVNIGMSSDVLMRLIRPTAKSAFPGISEINPMSQSSAAVAVKPSIDFLTYCDAIVYTVAIVRALRKTSKSRSTRIDCPKSLKRPARI